MPVTPVRRVSCELIGRVPVVVEPVADEPPEEPKPKRVKTPFNFYAYPSPTNIIQYVAVKHGMSYRAIIGTSRFPSIVRARHEAMRLVKTHCPSLSPRGLGRVFHRDRTSVLNALGLLPRQRRAAMARAA